MQALNEFAKPEKVQSYLTDDWEGLVKSVESPTVDIPRWAMESDEAFVKWACMSREEVAAYEAKLNES